MKPLLDIAEAADALGVPKSWVRDAVTARRIPHTRIGRHVRFTQEHLDAIVAAGEQPTITARTRRASVVPIGQKRRSA